MGIRVGKAAAEGDYWKAIDWFARDTDRNQRNVVALNNRPWLLTLRARKKNEALNLVNQAIDIAGLLSNPLDTRGVIYLTLGQHKKAAEDLEKAVAVNPSANRWYHLALAYLLDGDRIRAGKAWQPAKDLNINEKVLHALR
jgi:tetratricopeptide (TPR) repeat protein